MGELLDKGANLVTDTAVVPEGVGFARRVCRQARRVIEADVQHFRVAWKGRTGFMRVAADGHDIIKRQVLDILEGF